MKLQVWAEVELPDPEEGETVNDYVRTIQDEYPSLAGLVADYIDDPEPYTSKVIVALNGRRVVLLRHPDPYCPRCQHRMEVQSGQFLLRCMGCGHAEGDTFRR